MKAEFEAKEARKAALTRREALLAERNYAVQKEVRRHRQPKRRARRWPSLSAAAAC